MISGFGGAEGAMIEEEMVLPECTPVRACEVRWNG